MAATAGKVHFPIKLKFESVRDYVEYFAKIINSARQCAAKVYPVLEEMNFDFGCQNILTVKALERLLNDNLRYDRNFGSARVSAILTPNGESCYALAIEIEDEKQRCYELMSQVENVVEVAQNLQAMQWQHKKLTPADALIVTSSVELLASVAGTIDDFVVKYSPQPAR